MAAIIVGGENQGLIRQREQLAGDRIVLVTRVAACEIGAPGAVDKQHVAGEDAIPGEQANRIGSVAGSMEDADFLIANFERLTIFNVNTYVRSWRETMHYDWRIGKHAQLHRAAAMIGVSMRVDDRIEAQSVIREDCEVALDLVAQGIDDGSPATRFRNRKVRLALATIEFAKDHDGNAISLPDPRPH